MEDTILLTLNLPPNKQAIIEQASREAGMSVEQYIISKIFPRTTLEKSEKPKTLSELIGNRKLQSLTDDPVALQQTMRDKWE